MKISIATILLLLTASAASYTFGLAGGVLEGTHLSVGGLIIGIALNFSVAIISTNRGGNTAKKRSKQQDTWLAVLMVLTPVLVSPMLMQKPALMSMETLDMLGMQFRLYAALYAVGWSLAPDAIMLALGASNGSKGVLKLDTIITLYNPKWFKKETVNEGKPLVKKKLPVKQVSNKPKKLKQVDNKPKQVDKKKKIGKGFTDKQLVNLMEKYPNKSLRFYGEKLGVSGEGVRLRKKKLSNTG